MNLSGWAGKNPRVGFIGLGDQGGPIAIRIVQSGFSLNVWARRASSVEPFIAAGATVSTDPAELASRSDVVGLCVLDDAAVIEVFDALVPGLASGSVVLIHATVHPQTCRRLAERGAASGIFVIDAPVSGGAAAALAGELTVMAGGDVAAFEACLPVLNSFARLALHMGDIGAGQLTKLVNNALFAANLALADEAVRLAEGLGLDLARFNEVLAASSGASMAQRLHATLAGPGTFPWSGVMRKDLSVLASAATEAGLSCGGLTDIGGRYLDLVDAARALGTPAADA